MREVDGGCWPWAFSPSVSFGSTNPFFPLPFLPKVRFLLCLLCNRGLAGCQEHVEWKCEVKLAFAEGERLSTLPRPVPTSCVDLFPVITGLFVFLLGTRFGCPIGFQRRHHRPPRKGLPPNDRVPRCVLFSTFSLPEPPPFKSHFHAKLAIFTLSPRPIRARNFEPRNWTAVIYARSEIFHQLSATDFRVGSMNEVVFQEVDPATMMFLGKSFFFVSVS